MFKSAWNAFLEVIAMVGEVVLQRQGVDIENVKDEKEWGP